MTVLLLLNALHFFQIEHIISKENDFDDMQWQTLNEYQH